ncbi:Nn.00g083150.m01.CDS01 [Neocucurbitaria sp. VM-36]
MSKTQSWNMLPPDLVELQIGQIDLLMAMYPDEIILPESSKKDLDTLRDTVDNSAPIISKSARTIAIALDLPVSAPGEDPSCPKTLRLDLSVPFIYEGDTQPQDPPNIKVRVLQPHWLSRAATDKIMLQQPDSEDLLGTIEHIKETTAQHLLASEKKVKNSDIIISHTGPLVRVWFYFPSISTRSKRDDFIKYAPSYNLTGFLYAGKPGLLCVEGNSQSIDDYMKFIKTESWGDIPAHHKKVSERHREKCDERVFKDMTEITDVVGERRGQRANRGDMKAVEEWLVERNLGDAFTKVLM